MLRIISGEHKGRLLKTLEGTNTRPTSDRIKESLFNIIQFAVPGSHVLDLFAGTGNLGLEALSRGSLFAVFVEKDSRVLSVLKGNCKDLGYTDKTKIMLKDAVKAVEELSHQSMVFNIIFMDPPYDKELEVPVLTAIDSVGILAEDGIVIVEHLSIDEQLDRVNGLHRFELRKFGNTSISMYRKGG